jgi:hypothetical protein
MTLVLCVCPPGSFRSDWSDWTPWRAGREGRPRLARTPGLSWRQGWWCKWLMASSVCHSWTYLPSTRKYNAIGLIAATYSSLRKLFIMTHYLLYIVQQALQWTIYTYASSVRSSEMNTDLTWPLLIYSTVEMYTLCLLVAGSVFQGELYVLKTNVTPITGILMLCFLWHSVNILFLSQPHWIAIFLYTKASFFPGS